MLWGVPSVTCNTLIFTRRSWWEYWLKIESAGYERTRVDEESRWETPSTACWLWGALGIHLEAYESTEEAHQPVLRATGATPKGQIGRSGPGAQALSRSGRSTTRYPPGKQITKSDNLQDSGRANRKTHGSLEGKKNQLRRFREIGR